MTIIAGIVRINGEALPDGWVASLRSAISRYESDVPACAASDWFVVAKVDIGALPVRGDVVTSDGGIAMVAGDPVMTFGRERTGDRRTDVESLFAAWRQRRAEPLESCQGTYCAVLLDPPKSTTLSRRRQARRSPAVLRDRRRHDLLRQRDPHPSLSRCRLCPSDSTSPALPRPSRSGFRSALVLPTRTSRASRAANCSSSRTAVRTVNSIGAGTSCPGTNSSQVSSLPTCTRASSGRSHDVSARNRRSLRSCQAVSIHAASSPCCAKVGARVHTMNFAPEGTLDLELGRRVAESLVTDHFEHPLGPAVIGDKQVIAHAAWRKRQAAHDSAVTSPSVIWSGDGGSVGMGHVIPERADGANRAAGRHRGGGAPRPRQ